jgi:hypothetical protein
MNPRILTKLCLTLTLIVLPSLTVRAEQTKTPKATIEKQAGPTKQQIELAAKTEALKQRTTAIVAKLDKTQQQHFYIVFRNYNFISLVRAVENDISEAVDGCSKNNPDMEDQVRRRFANWQKNLETPKKEAAANIDNMILAQNYATKEEMNGISAIIDDMRAINSSRFESTPVTTKEACEYMLSKMDETQKDMETMLRSTLISYPNALQKNQK